MAPAEYPQRPPVHGHDVGQHTGGQREVPPVGAYQVGTGRAQLRQGGADIDGGTATGRRPQRADGVVRLHPAVGLGPSAAQRDERQQPVGVR